GGRNLLARRSRAFPCHSRQRCRAVWGNAAEGAGWLPDWRLRDAAAAARIGGALGRPRIRFHRLGRRWVFRLSAAGWPNHHLSGGRRLSHDGRRYRCGGRLYHLVDIVRLHARAGVGIAVLRARFRPLAYRRGAAPADCRGTPGAYRDACRACADNRKAMILAVNILLWLVVGVLAFLAALRGRVLFSDGAREGVWEFIRLLPRIGAGVVGSGFIAEVLPKALVASWIGPGSGFIGVLIATLGGALTPGGPVVGFSIGAAALKGGAGAPQVIAYSTAWALYAIHRLVIWEVPMMPPRLVWLRAAVSVPLPFIAAAIAMALAKP